MEEQTHEQSEKSWKIDKVNKGLTHHVNFKEMQKNEVDGNQRKREGSHEVRKNELKNEWCKYRKKGGVKTKIDVQFF